MSTATRSTSRTSRRQSTFDKPGLSPVLATVDFVAGVVNRYLRNALLLLFEISSVVSFARSKTQTLKFKLQKVWSEIMAYLVNILKIAFNYQWCGVSKIQVSRYVSYMLRKYLVFSPLDTFADKYLVSVCKIQKICICIFLLMTNTKYI